MPECATCQYADKINYLENMVSKEADKNSQQHKEFYESITEIKLAAKETQSDIKVMKNDMAQMIDMFREMKADTEQLKSKPSKKLDSVSTSITGGVLLFIIVEILKYIIK